MAVAPARPAPDLAGIDPERGRELVTAALSRDGAGWLATSSAEQLLAVYGIPSTPSQRCRDPDSAAAAAVRFDVPVALKASFPAPGQPDDIDMLLGLSGEAAIREGWRELRRRVEAAGRRWPAAVLVQPLAAGGADVLVGSVTDPDLGPLVGVGLGGRQAALARAVAFRLAPHTDADAEELIAASRSVSAWLDGYRGSPPLDRLALRELVLRFARLLADLPELVEADLNPVRVMRAGCSVLDARLRIAPPTSPPRIRTW